MVRSASDQAQLVEDLLDVSRIVSNKFQIDVQPIDLALVIRDAMDGIQPSLDAKQLRLHKNIAVSPCMIAGDASRLQQVLWNLLSNAIKFTPEGGDVWVELVCDTAHATIMVRDSGQGISADFLPFVFDRFRQAESTSNRLHNGLGLGLSIVHHIVELHSGTITASSDGEAQGATFRVLLPLLNQDAESATDPQRTPVGGGNGLDLRGLRVLVVDDQTAILDLLHDVLVQSGAVVQQCDSAERGLALVRSWRPDVLVSDLGMPDKDGYWLIGQVRALPPDQGGATPAVALTAYVRVEERVGVLAAGFQLYVPKPVEPAELVAVVARAARLLG